MAYVKNIWVDQDVERPKTYEVTNNQDGSITLTDSFGLVTELGTPVNEVNMNHIEDGIDGCAIRKHNLTETFNLGEWVLGGADDNEGIYKSLVTNNVGNAITDETKWQKVSMGSGGLEIGDIGIAPLGIDETKNLRRYANGQVIIQDQFVSFTTKLKKAVALYPSLTCTEAQWQATATLSVGGQVGKFVIDDTAGTIRLPKIIMPIQGLTNLASLAEIVEAGLPNITGSFTASSDRASVSGAFTQSVIGAMNFGTIPSSNERSYAFNASRSSSIYDNSDTVQQEQIQYPYFIQVATGVEESVDVTREIELNNPFSLFDYKYSEYELDNISWLRSNGQYNSKSVYPDAYDLLLKIYNGTETKAGVSVKLSTETYTDTDFVLNTSNETFRLPLKVALASGKAVVGNGMTLGLTDGTQFAGLGKSNNSGLGYPINIYSNSYGSVVGSELSGNINNMNNTLGVTTDATKSGIETSDNNLYLYFYVGETVQNANLINAGRIEEKLTTIIPDNSNLIASYGIPDYANGISVSTSPYTAPSAGYFFGVGDFGTEIMTQVYVNNVRSAYVYSGTGRTQSSFFIPVSKGDIVTITKMNSCMFFPMKGAN